MKKISLLVPVLILVFGLQINVSAQTDSSSRESAMTERKAQYVEMVAERKEQRSENMEVRREQFQNKIEEKKENIAQKRLENTARREERKIKLDEARKERVSNLFGKMFEGFANAANRLDDIYERLNNKITEKESSGEDVSTAKELLLQAGDLLDETLAELVSVQEEINKNLETEVSKEYLKELIASAKESIRKTHEAFRAVISEINKQKDN